MRNRIAHTGIVEEISGDGMKVKILQSSACSSCKVAGYCHASEQKEKLIDVNRPKGMPVFQKGDEVTVVASVQTGARAVILAFVIPFLLMVGTVFACSRLTADEPTMALAGLLVLVPYYICLFLLRKRLKRQFTFSVEK